MGKGEYSSSRREIYFVQQGPLQIKQQDDIHSGREAVIEISPRRQAASSNLLLLQNTSHLCSAGEESGFLSSISPPWWPGVLHQELQQTGVTLASKQPLTCNSPVSSLFWSLPQVHQARQLVREGSLANSNTRLPPPTFQPWATALQGHHPGNRSHW